MTKSMTDLQTYLNQLKQQRVRLRQQAVAGDHLHHQPADYDRAIVLTEQALAGEIDEAEWRAALAGLAIDWPMESPPQGQTDIIVDGDVVGGDKVEGDKVLGDKITEYTGIDQRGQTVQGNQYNVGGINIYSRPMVGRPFQAPPLPAHFVPRPEVTEALKARLLKDSPTTPGILVVSAIHGLGGIGKSTLAAALAYDPDVQNRFEDGILWATLGQQPDLLSLLSSWVQALGDYDFRPTTVEAATLHLRTLLQDKAILLVVDDVWNPEHTKLLHLGGPRCQVLITTREAIVAEAVGADLYNLDVMSMKQALLLLSRKLKRDFSEDEREQALSLVKTVDYHPLALVLAAAQVADGISWMELMSDLLVEIAKLEALDRPEAYEVKDEALRKELSLHASLYLSLHYLPEEKFRNFAWLGVLPEDVMLTPAMAATFWNTDTRQAHSKLLYLHRKALLSSGVALPDGTRTYRLHDLLHALARNLLQAPVEPAQANELPGLGLELSSAHDLLLAQYRKQTRDNQWHTLPNDGYIHAHLTWHMEQAGQVEQIHALLREETVEGQNGWHEVCEGMGQMTGYLEDIARAWRLAEEKFIKFSNRQSSTSPSPIGLQCRYALIIASLNSLVENIPPMLIVTLVEKEIWSPDRGLTYARRIPDSSQRVETLEELAIVLAKLNQPKKALTATQAIGDGRRLSFFLEKLARHVPESLQRDLVEMANAIEGETDKSYALGWLAPHLPEMILLNAWTATQTIKDPERRAWTLIRLANCLSGTLKDEVSQEALEAALTIDTSRETYSQSQILMWLAPHLPKRLLEQAVETAKAIKWTWTRAKTLIEFVPYLHEPLKSRVLQEIVTAVQKEEWTHNLEGMTVRLAELGYPQEAFDVWREIKSRDTQAKELSNLIPFLPENMIEVALRELLLANHALWYTNKSELLAEQLSHLPETLFEEVIEVAHSTKWRYSWVHLQAITAIAVRLAELGHYDKALAEAREFENSIVLHEITSLLPHPMRDEVLSEIVTLTADKERSVRALADLNHFDEAVVVANSIEKRTEREEVLAGIVVKLVEKKHYQQAIDLTWMIEGENRAKLLIDIAPQIPVNLLKQVFEAAQAIEPDEDRAKALAGVAPYLQQAKLLQEALMTVSRIEKEEARVDALLGVSTGDWWADHTPGLVSYLSEAFLEDALKIAWTIKETKARARLVNGLASHLSKPLLRHVLAVMWRIGDKNVRDWLLSGLFCYLPESLLPKAHIVALTIENNSLRTLALAGLADRLLDSSDKFRTLQKALTAVQAIEYPRDRTKTLGELAPHLTQLPPHLSEPLLKEAFTAVKMINDEQDRAWALAYLAPHLPQSIFPEALEVARNIEIQRSRIRALSGLIPYLPSRLKAEVLQELLTEATRIFDNFDLIWLLRWSAPHFTEPILLEVLKLARAKKSDTIRAIALAELAPYLPSPIQENVLREGLVALLPYVDDFQPLKLQALAKLAPLFSESLLRKALEAAQEVKSNHMDKYFWYQLITILVPHLVKFNHSGEMINRAQAAIGLSGYEEYLLAELHPNLVKFGHYQEAIIIVQMISQEELRAKALTEIVPHLPEDLLAEAVEEMQKIKDEALRAEIMMQLMLRFVEHAPTRLYSFWRETLPILTQGTRQDLLSDFQTLTPVIVALGGPEAIEETYLAIRDVGRWWP